ncbi:MAG: thioredoxin fold domain-containing protein [Planctomycetia bacterium]|nr:thioredoxin fold domain-containing protein [Planctomycetia bacterium]
MGRLAYLFARCAAVGALALASAATARADGLAFEPASVTLPAALERAKAADGLVLVDLVTPTCRWCKVLERETFPDPRVGEALGPTLCLRVEAGSPEGAGLVRRFGVRGYPTILFLDGDGREVDRVVGFLAAERFAAEVARIRRGEGTLKALRLAHEADPAAAGPAVAYARRLVKVGETGAARALLVAVADAPAGGGSSGSGSSGGGASGVGTARPAALLGLAELSLRLDDDAKALAYAARVTDEFPASKEAADAWLLRVQVHAGQGEIETALAEVVKARAAVRDDAAVVALETTAFWLHRRRTETTLVRWGERALAAADADALHRAARAALEARLVLGTALRWAETAADLSGRDPEVLATWAELLAETGNDERALAVGREALRGVRDGDGRTKLEAVLARLARCAPAGDRASRSPAPTSTPPPAPPPPSDADRVPDAPPPPPAPAPAPAPETPCPDPQRCVASPVPSDVVARATPVSPSARCR